MSIFNLAESHGAIYVPFEQENLLDGFNTIEAKQVGTARSWIDVPSDNSTLGGLCLGLCLMMINGSFNYIGLTELLDSPVGKGQVRGYQFLQSTSKRQHLLKLCCPEFTVSSKWKHSKTFKSFSSYIDKEQNCSFYGHLECKIDNHAICLQKVGEKITVFDPNWGVFVFFKVPSQKVMSFLDDLTKFTPEYGGVGKLSRLILKMAPKDI